MNDDPNIEPVDLSPTRAELIARVRSRGRKIRAHRRMAVSGIAALIVVAIAIPAIALGSRTPSHTIGPAATTTTKPVVHSDFRVAIITRVSPQPGHFGGPCDATDGKLCYVLGANVMTARDVRGNRVVEDARGRGWDVELTVTASAIRRLAAHVNQQAAIIIGGSVISTPMVQPGVTGTTIQISNRFTHAQATRIAAEILGRTPPAETVTTTIELPEPLVFAASQEVHGTLVVDNETGAPWPLPVDHNGCETPWAIVLTNAIVPPDAVFTLECRAGHGTLPTGVTQLPFTTITRYSHCTNSRSVATDDVTCLPTGNTPALPAGRYNAVMYGGAGWPTPPPVAVTLATLAVPR